MDRETRQAFASIHAYLDRITRMLRHLHKDEIIIMAAIDDLKTEVARNTDVQASAVATLNGLGDMLDDAIAAGDPAAIQAMADTLRANTDALAAAIVANTPPPAP